MGLLASLLGWLGLARAPAQAQDARAIADVYRSLREQALTVSADALGLKRDPRRQVWGVVVDHGSANGVATIVALGDGTVSLYFSGGGGIIGLGGRPEGRRAGSDLLRAAQEHLTAARHTTTFPLPAPGHVIFHLHTHDGVFAADVAEEELVSRRLPWSSLFDAVQAVITQARLADEERRRGAASDPE